MQNEKALTLLDVVVIVVIVSVVLVAGTILLRRVGKGQVDQAATVDHIAQRVVCSANLYALGRGMELYSKDYDGEYPSLPGKGLWSKELGFDYYMSYPSFKARGLEEHAGRTITASWYLLVRESDVSPKSFVCPAGGQIVFDGGNPTNRDITQLWDFGADPYDHVSYSMQHPYGRFGGDDSRSSAFGMAADMSPWFNDGDIVSPGKDGETPQLIGDNSAVGAVAAGAAQKGNSRHHDTGIGQPCQGQNVLFGDTHVSYEERSDIGVRGDNIYTYWSKPWDQSDRKRRGRTELGGLDQRAGTNPTARDKENDAKSPWDSFLAI